jgi:hypothetical protein
VPFAIIFFTLTVRIISCESIFDVKLWLEKRGKVLLRLLAFRLLLLLLIMANIMLLLMTANIIQKRIHFCNSIAGIRQVRRRQRQARD